MIDISTKQVAFASFRIKRYTTMKKSILKAYVVLAVISILPITSGAVQGNFTALQYILIMLFICLSVYRADKEITKIIRQNRRKRSKSRI